MVTAVTFAPETTTAAFNWLGWAVAGIVERVAPVVGPTLADHAKDTVETAVESVVGRGRLSESAGRATHSRVLHATGCSEEATRPKRRAPEDEEERDPSPQRLRLT